MPPKPAPDQTREDPNTDWISSRIPGNYKKNPMRCGPGQSLWTHKGEGFPKNYEPLAPVVTSRIARDPYSKRYLHLSLPLRRAWAYANVLASYGRCGSGVQKQSCKPECERSEEDSLLQTAFRAASFPASSCRRKHSIVTWTC